MSTATGLALDSGTDTRSDRRGVTPGLAALVVLAAVQLMVVLDTTIVNVALPSIQNGLGFSAGNISWVINGYALTFGALLMFGGRSGDLLGRRNVFIAALVAFAAASMIGGLSASPAMLISARVGQGVAAAFAQATTLSLMVATFPSGRARNRAVGVFAAMEGLGAAIGLLLGGVLVDSFSWRWVFFVNVPVAALLAALAPLVIASPARQRVRIDLPGAASAAAGLGLIVFGLSRAAEHGWTDLSTLVPLVVGALGVAGFVLIEARSKNPLIPLWVFVDRNRGGAYAIQAFIGAALFGMFFLSTLFMQHVLGYSPLKAGLAFIPTTIIMMAGAGIASKVVARTGVRPLVVGGMAIASMGMVLLSHLSPHSADVIGVMLPMIVLGFGLGATFVPLTLSAVSGVGEHDSGLVSGVSTTSIQIGGSIGVAVLGTVAATTAQHSAGASVPLALAAGYTHAFGIGAILIAAAIPIALVFLRLHPTNEAAPEIAVPDQVGSEVSTPLSRDRLQVQANRRAS
jgi:EmrB/QacA subfamily drug resistance transporter